MWVDDFVDWAVLAGFMQIQILMTRSVQYVP